jgi:hypothetical protein
MEPLDEAGRGVRMEIRGARTEDAEPACTVLRRSIQELCHADHNGDAARLADWLFNKTPENVAAWIRNPQSLVFVATEGATILGVAAMTKAGKITLNYVSPELRCGDRPDSSSSQNALALSCRLHSASLS